jgi:hypothetical protein
VIRVLEGTRDAMGKVVKSYEYAVSAEGEV